MRPFQPIVCGVLVFSGLAFARQSSADTTSKTITLNQSKAQVVYATLQAGKHQNTNLPTTLTVHPADTKDNNRRAFVKFDTQNTIQAGSVVTSAKMTVTVKSGTGSASRTIGAYQVTMSWAETEMTWNRRRTGIAWMTAGGDLGSLIAKQEVAKTAGTKITFDVTALVKQAVAGKLGSSRYTRLALIDLDAASDSTRDFYTPDEGNASLRPVLTVVYSVATKPAPAPPPPPSTGNATLRVLHWNTHHGGVGSDGKLDPDRLISKAASYKPDIVSMNEVEHFTGWGNNDGPAVLTALMKKYTGTTWYYKFTTATGAAKGNGNLIMSRFPFDSSEIRLLSHDRAAIDVVINVNGRSINVMSTHLDDNSRSERLDEIGELTSWAKGVAEPRIIAGDFNATPSSTEHTTMQKTYVDSWTEAEGDGTAVAYPGNTSGKTRGGRIDYIYYSKGTTMLKLESSQVFDARDAHGVMPSDHRPLLAIFTVK